MKTKRIIYLSLITVIGIALNILESFIPLPVSGIPGAKLGLANIVNLVTMTVFGFKHAIIVGTLRCFMATLVTGAVTGIFYSLSGSIFSTIIMWIVYKYFSEKFSLIGVSIFGAISHNIAQLTVASIMINNFLIFTYLPFMMLMSLFTGYFVGLTGIYTSNHLKKIEINALE
ncbi:Gx transporter family protein [Crassaminicella thermophila]|uniref:Gx transporter family protein n=1 Tax=Crassaminicella thermophila TaxID=2599308 RepID=A0A5C0SDX3_CRATE|nr:Gx transporter family protein [Crassaminicella thermophila]QEK12310.1 Gx transporter family protein [Crassaminicella thermophila]